MIHGLRRSPRRQWQQGNEVETWSHYFCKDGCKSAEVDLESKTQ